MAGMKTLPGFPVVLGGTKKFRKHDEWLDEQKHLAALGQLIEATILDRGEFRSEDEESLAQELVNALEKAGTAQHLVTIRAARLGEMVLELEFTAVGYPGRYIKAMHLDGSRGVYKLRHLEQPRNDIIEHHRSEETSDGALCVADAAIDGRDAVSRVTVKLEFKRGEDASSRSVEGVVHEAERFAGKIARELAEA